MILTVNPIRPEVLRGTSRPGGVYHTPPMKKFKNAVLFNSFTHSQLCIYTDIKSQVSSILLLISGFGGHSKFGRKIDSRVKFSKIKIYKGKIGGQLFWRAAKN